MLLPTRPQRHCDPAALVSVLSCFPFVLFKSILELSEASCSLWQRPGHGTRISGKNFSEDGHFGAFIHKRTK